MNYDTQINYYAIIPATIRYDERLKFAERLLYGEITALCNKEGYCFASNRYFADLYRVSISTISRWISHLAEIGSIDVKIIKNEKNEVIERRIYIIENTYMQNCRYPYMQKNQYPIRKKSKDNNININKIDRLFNYIIKEEEIFFDEIKNIDIQKIRNVLSDFEMLYTKDMIKHFYGDNLERIKIVICTLIELTIMGKNLNGISRERLFVIYDKCQKNDTEIVDFYEYYLISVLNELYKP